MEQLSRRVNDKRMDVLEDSVNEIKEVVDTIKIKIFNGFDKSISSTENKVNYIDERNTNEHLALRSDIKSISTKLDRMLWAMVGVSFLLIVSEFVKGLL